MRIPAPPTIGARMRAAARESGFTAEQIAQELGVRPQTVYRWWTNERVPERDWLARYAALVRRPVTFFYTDDRLAELVGFLREFIDLTMAGEEPTGAWDQLTGRPDILSPEDQRVLRESRGQMRDYIRGVRANWEILSD